ncbi:xanthine dehydrogenase family protein molybdopterin-binding subunit [Geothrix sp. SG200]|uniref:xanthine dehydrogenase family protein molybdopterin-binding subunit n=1 Tax=Geothrix sp. SG200 TaxID=2922865 RepID=UPI001FACCDA5|nr:xanthine dehydrogenase family protein molybdopterin-binding subunit [Geothrix sp. SG200]
MSTTRRDFLKTTGALTLAFALPVRLKGAAAQPTESAFQPSGMLRIDPDGSVTIWATRTEMGQGVRTSMAMAIAEELEADWSRVKILQASTAPRFGDLGVTGGSQTTLSTTQALRKVGAQAREMLLQAGADTWGVAKSECLARGGHIQHPPTKRSLAYGELAARAGKLTPPPEPPLKAPKDFRILGKDARRLDGPDIVAGKAQFTTDLHLPGMLVASIERCPVFGGKVKSFDASAARKVPGVKQVLEVPSGVAVFGEDTWAAFAGREALKVQWDEGPAAKMDSASIRRQYEERLKTPGKVVRQAGDAAQALPKAAKRIKATYDAPFLAHATMEPMVAVADVKPGRCMIWAPTQAPGMALPAVEQITGLKADQIEIQVMLAGGGFGRRAMADFIADAVACSKAVGAPVKVQWTRPDDFRHDGYRPATLHELEAGLDAQGRPLAWMHRFVGPSIAASNHFPWPPEATELAGAADLAYDIPNLHVEWGQSDTPVPIWFWRAVPASFNPFVTECFLDELAHAAGKDPLAFRLAHLPKAPLKLGQHTFDPARYRAVLELAAAKAGWRTRKLPKGRGRGIAAHAYLDCGTYVAQVAEVEAKAGGGIRVHRVVCAVDCGMTLNPGNVKAQMEGGIAFGLSAALYDEITLKDGRVTADSFSDHPILLLPSMPKVEVHIVPSELPPGGVGEPGLPPLAPAVANAVFAATGMRLRSLPLLPPALRKA